MRIAKLLVTAGLCAAATVAQAAPAKVTAAIDSTVVEMGSRARITVNVNDPSRSGQLVDAPKAGTTSGDIDIIEVNVDTVPAGYTYDILIQAFTPGMATLPPFRYATGADTAESDILTLKVLPVDLDSLETINPMESIADAPSRWYDWIPDWIVWVILGLALAAVAVCLWLVYRKHGTLIVRHVKPVDPYELAMSELARLRDRKLAETGQEKEYYTTLVDILRKYLDGRFGINAMEMSSTQILASLRENPDTRGNHTRIKQILELADFVKFAKVRPLPDDNIKTYNNVVQFVEETKPEPAPDESQAGAAKGRPAADDAPVKK
ncbi:MAG: BatD family protein [Bacteroidales bacterium]|nr:BatD family protein [Bacteroidales bacterium]